MTFGHRVVSAGLAALLVAGPAALCAAPAGVALADPASDLEAAAAELDSLGSELAERQGRLASATEALEDTDYRISEQQRSIDETTEELAARRAELGESMSSSYKAGSDGLLGFILGSTTADELASRIFYLDKVSEQQAGAIARVRELAEQLQRQMSELEDQQADQRGLVDALQAEVADYQARVSDAAALYDSLDEQAREALAAQESDNVSTAVEAVEAEQARQQDAAQTGAATSDGDAGDSGSDGGSAADQGDDAPAAEPETPQESAGADERPAETGDGQQAADGGSEQTEAPDAATGDDAQEPSAPSGGTSVAAGQGVATAYALIGKAYVYGASGPDAFDCSGLVCYCYGSARGRTTGAMIQSLQASGDWKTDLSQLQPGDLVFPSYGHVGIYVGDGQMIHAANPALGVVLAPVYAFVGGGSYY